MPAKKSSRISNLTKALIGEKLTAQKAVMVSPPKTILILASTFLVIWILIGLFLLVVIVQGLRTGTFLLGPSKNGQQTQTQETQAPTEANLPGIGRVNIACVKEALSQETIQKLLEKGDLSVLEGEEKAKFQACIISKASPIPTQSPSQ